jgi:hypothetical protein
MRYAIAVLAVAACSRDNHVTLAVGNGSNICPGFTCDGSDGQPIIYTEALATAPHTVGLVLDIITLPTLPDCSGDSIIDACRAGSGSDDLCALQTSIRKCLTLDGTGMSSDVSANIEADLASRADLFDGVPAGPIMIRAVFVAACDADGGYAEDFTKQTVLGCGYTCPAVLDDVRGELPFEIGVSDPLGGPDNAAECSSVIFACSKFPDNLPGP